MSRSEDDSKDEPLTELDIYASEFAELVNRHTPSRRSTPSDWLRRLPSEVFDYYQQGLSTFESSAGSPAERRGRLYLIHSGLLFMWMMWGKEKTRRSFKAHAARCTRRAATLAVLEQYRRAGILAHYSVPDWFSDPVGEWIVEVTSTAVDADALSDQTFRDRVQSETTIRCTVGTLSNLRRAGALPPARSLSVD
jgi:hypothetical protein